MKPSTRTALKSLFEGLAWLFFIIAGLAFWFGGRVISAFGTTDRILAEVEGIVLTLLFVGLGVVAKAAEDRLEEGETKSLSELLRK